MRIFFSAGEASGDAYAGALIDAIESKFEFEGIGGRYLHDSGAKIVADSRKWGAVGILESLKVVPDSLVGYWRAKFALASGKPGLFVAIDFGFMNIKLARYAKAKDWKVLYFVPPGSWRRDKQGADLAIVSDQIVTPFSWSADILRKMGANVHYFGHPILSMIPRDTEIARSSDKVVIMPGSRMHEVESNMAVILESARQAGVSKLELVLAPTISDHDLAGVLKSCNQAGLEMTTTRDRYTALREARAGILCSGTATLESALCGCPCIVMYRGSKMAELEFKIRKPKFEFISLPNLILRRKVLPELILNDAIPETIAPLLKELLSDSEARELQITAFKELRDVLMPDDAIAKTAELIHQMVKESTVA